MAIHFAKYKGVRTLKVTARFPEVTMEISTRKHVEGRQDDDIMLFRLLYFAPVILVSTQSTNQLLFLMINNEL